MNWKWQVAAGLLAAICVSALSWPIALSYARLEFAPYRPLMEASVKIHAGGGTGSGIHIGGGDIVTAAHVVEGAKEVFIEYQNGSKIKVAVLWVHKEFDIALLHIERRVWAESAPLDCSVNVIGTEVVLVGNPMDVDFVWTRGVIVGKARPWGPWASVVPVDGTAIYGQSGGGAVDRRGRTVGITVGLINTYYGIAAFGWIVPASVVCTLIKDKASA